MNSLAPYSAPHWDSHQKAVIESERAARVIVEAGPGTGKTAVSCARLAGLVHDQGVLPSKCWMISFTRTAVAEIRARLYSYLGEDAFSVKVATIDSQAWAIHSGIDSTASLTGSHEQNIDDVLRLVGENEDVRDYISSIEHLIVDEAQDFVGNRADLVLEMIRAMDAEAGVTVFADEAQAIYGFAEKVAEGESKVLLLPKLRDDLSLGFGWAELQTVHRTKSIGLLNIFRNVRKKLTQKTLQPGIFGEIRSGILEHADENDLINGSVKLEDLPSSSLILFRKRSQALEKSQYAAPPHSLRLQGYGINLPPWIALCFWDYLQSYMDKESFARRWLERVEKSCPPQYGMEEAWKRLLRAGQTGDGSIDIKMIRARLGNYSPPLELTDPDFGLPGPVIGTIHASKGREADDVILFLPEAGEFKSHSAEEEEARVIFVGSTRGRSTLRVGKAAKSTGRTLGKRRAYRKVDDTSKGVFAMVEIGLPDDLTSVGQVGVSVMSQADALVAQKWLQERAGTMITGLRLKPDSDLEYAYRLYDPQSETILCYLSKQFSRDLWSICKELAEEKPYRLRTPSEIWYIRFLGCRSIVLSGEDPDLSLLHAPWSQTGFLLAPRVVSFTKTAFWKAK